MNLISITINNEKIKVKEGITILDAAKKLNINIPTLCHLKLHDSKENNPGSCRICVVEIQGRKNLAPACCTPVADNMVIQTNSLKVIKARKTILELLLSNHPHDCFVCEKNTKCELQKLAYNMGIDNIKFKGDMSTFPKDKSSHSIVRDMDKCILCNRCVTMCNEVQTVGVLSAINRGFNTIISPAFDMPLNNTNCTFCGQCVSICPTGALTEFNDTLKVCDCLSNPEKVVIVQTAPAIRASLGEEFGLTPDSNITGKMVSALKLLGFDKVFDTNFAADLTIIEEASELVHRLNERNHLPMFTSCCPAWIKFCEHEFPDILDNISTCKSPQQMFGSIAKTYFANKMNIDPKNLVVVSVMPCIAKKYECKRTEMYKDNIPDVDIVITTRELSKMIKNAGINFNVLESTNFDSPLGESTGAGSLFGITGGVTEAALRTAYEWINKTSLENLNFEFTRGFKGVKEGRINLGEYELKVAIISGLGNARKVIESIKKGLVSYDLVEVMACPGGCINGGGQPYTKDNEYILKQRMKVLYEEDKIKFIKKSHKNPFIKKLYKEFLQAPHSEKAHNLLHTTYKSRR